MVCFSIYADPPGWQGWEVSYENDDLLDFAAAETILNSGQVFAVPREQLPGDGDLAAILRYAVQPP